MDRRAGHNSATKARRGGSTVIPGAAVAAMARNSSSGTLGPISRRQGVSARGDSGRAARAQRRRAAPTAPPPAETMTSPLPGAPWRPLLRAADRSEEHTSELQSLMRISYAVFCLKKKTKIDSTKVLIITHKNNNTKTT